MAYAFNSEVELLLKQADWKTIRIKLLEHAAFKIRRLYWKSGQELLPKGLSAEDIAIDAIQKTLDGVRVWDPRTCPDLLVFLKAVVDSDVSHLVNSEEHKSTQYADADDEQPDWASSERNPEEKLLHQEAIDSHEKSFRRFIESMFEEFRNDPEVTALLLSYRNQADGTETIRPSVVAAESGLDIQSIRNAMKRLRRRIATMRLEPVGEYEVSHVR